VGGGGGLRLGIPLLRLRWFGHRKLLIAALACVCGCAMDLSFHKQLSVRFARARARCVVLFQFCCSRHMLLLCTPYRI